ncbi:MAG: glycosyltransferase [Bacteroidota bacterium]
MIKDYGAIPLVSICTTTFNHEKYLSECLDGLLMQQTSFPFEILVHEDASTDNTAKILREYEQNYPHIIRCVYQTENQFLKQNTLINILFRMARGKYVALCEGDDYWTDPLKLQKQVDFLEQHPDYVLCSADARIENLTSQLFRAIYTHFDRDMSFNQAQVLTDFYCPTLSMVFRNNVMLIPDWFHNVKSGDSFLHYLLSRHGKFYFMNFIAGVYRQHNAGISNTNNKISWFENNLEHLEKLRTYVDKESVLALKEQIYKNQLEYIESLKAAGQWRKALAVYFRMEKLPFAIRRKYLKQVSVSFARAVLRK